MGSWYKQNRFLKKREQFSHLDRMGFTDDNWSAYSTDYALAKILSGCEINGACFTRDVVISGYLITYYNDAAKLAVDVAYEDNSRRQKEDATFDRSLNKVGIKMLRLPKTQILKSPEQIKNIILEVLSERIGR